MKRRALFGVGVLVALVVLLFLLGERGAADPAAAEGGTKPAAVAEPGEPSGTVEVERRGVQRLRLVDALTGAPLRAQELEWEVGGHVEPLETPELEVSAGGPDPGRVRFDLDPLLGGPHAEHAVADLLERAEPSGAGVSEAAVPHDSRLVGVVHDARTGSPAVGVRVRAVLVDPELWQQAAHPTAELSPGLASGPAGTWVDRVSAYDLLRPLSVGEATGLDTEARAAVVAAAVSGEWPPELEPIRRAADEDYRFAWAESVTDEGGRFSLDLPGSGTFVLHVRSPDFENLYQEGEIGPGEVRDLALATRSRPRVRVLVTDAEGRPLSGAKVRISVWMDSQSYDWAREDEDLGFGASAMGPPGGMYWTHHRTRYTGDDGIAELTVPVGKAYAAWSLEPGGVFDFTSAPEEGAAVVELHLDLSPPGEDEGGVALILDQDGRPVRNGWAMFLIADDVPWVRTLPYVRLDEEGRVRMTCFEDGATNVEALVLPADATERDLRGFGQCSNALIWSDGLNVFHVEMPRE